MKFIKIFFAGILMILLIGCCEESSSQAPFDIEEASIIDSIDEGYMSSNIDSRDYDTNIVDKSNNNDTTTTIITTITETESETTTTSKEKENTIKEKEKEETTVSTTTVETTLNSEEKTEETTTQVYVVYKPSTGYFHKTTCRWFDNTCIFDWGGVITQGYMCSECHPEIPDVKIIEKKKTVNPVAAPVTQAEFYMLANLVAHEYGADWVPTAEKAKVVMTVMNRVNSSRYPNTIRSVILQRNQYCWVPDSYYWNRVTEDCKKAVTYYFSHQDQYSKNLFSFWGNGYQNFFY